MEGLIEELEPTVGDQSVDVDSTKTMENDSQAAESSLYAELVRDDVLAVVAPLLESRRFHLRAGDGKIVADHWSLLYKSPWHYTIPARQLDCWYATVVKFDTASQRTLKRWVPAQCQWCFKVVCGMETLRQLFAMKALQERLQIPSKCGCEVRKTVARNYGAYFYCRGLEEGREKYDIVRKAVSEDQELGPSVSVILKRACTEMELACGPSDKWELSVKQLRLENMIDQIFVRDPYIGPMPPHVVKHTLRGWIEYAYSIGDETYKLYTGGQPLYRPVVTYHNQGSEGK